MFEDYVLNGQGFGEVGQAMLESKFDPGLRRPYIDNDGHRYVTINTGRTQYSKEKNAMFPVYEKVRVSDLIRGGYHNAVFNSATSLRKNEWIEIDKKVIDVALPRLRAWGDLAGANSVELDGMSKMIFEHETMDDPGEALVDMDGLSEGRTDSPLYQLEGIPLPITHSDFWFSSRRLAVSRNTGTPLDLTMAVKATRRVVEKIEKTTIGTITGLTYGNTSDYSRAPSVYGYTNFPERVTKTDMVAPTGTNGQTVKDSWLALRELLYANNMYGPYMVYTSTDWDRYLDNTFSTNEPSSGTLRDHLLKIDGIQDIRRLDYLTNTFTVLMVQMTEDVCRAINGLNLTTVQWESQGGMRINFKVMCIYVPQIRADFNGNCGVAHGTTA